MSAADAHLAYQLLDEADVDLVLLDLHLPQMSGDTFYRRAHAPLAAPGGPHRPHDGRHLCRDGALASGSAALPAPPQAVHARPPSAYW